MAVDACLHQNDIHASGFLPVNEGFMAIDALKGVVLHGMMFSRKLKVSLRRYRPALGVAGNAPVVGHGFSRKL
jgi:hypothetical protein